MGDVLIELGDVSTDRPPAGPVAERRRPAPYRAVLTAVTVLLAATLTGAAHRPPPSPPVIVEARLGDLMFVGADEVFVVGSATAPTKTISRYALPGGELRSRTEVAVPGAIFNVVAAGAVILVSYQVDTAGAEATVAVAEDTGTAVWRQPLRLIAVSETDGLALLRENSPRFGDRTWAGMDVDTGTTRWTHRRPSRAVTTEAGLVDGFPRHLVTASVDGDLEVRDTRTGTVTATARAPVRMPGTDSPVWPTDHLVLVGAPGGTSAYELPSLVRRWTSGVDLAGRWVQGSCSVVICTLSRAGGLAALDPETGAAIWSSARWTYADQIGPYLVAGDASVSASRQQLAVLDPRTGQVRGAFAGWQIAGPARSDGTVRGLHEQLGDDLVLHGVLDPATLSVRELGRAEEVSGDCQIAGDVLVCRRIDAQVGIWKLRGGPG